VVLYKSCEALISTNIMTTVDIGYGVLLGTVAKICYLGDMLDAHGGCNSTALQRELEQHGKKFHEHLFILTR